MILNIKIERPYGMTPIITDSIIIVLLLISAIFAFMRGFIKEVLTIFSLLGAAAGAYIWGPKAIPFFTGIGIDLAGGEKEKIWGMIPPEIFGLILGYGSIFVGLFLALSLLSHFIGKMAEDMGLGSVDRTLGFVFGLARGIFILALLNIPVISIMDKSEQPDWLAQAKMMTVINTTSQIIVDAQTTPDDHQLEELKTKVIDLQKQKEQVEKVIKKGYELQQREDLQNLIEGIE